MNIAVVYYSMGGNTEAIAKAVAEKLGAETVKIEPKKAFPDKGFSKFFWGGKSAVMKETPELVPYIFERERYDAVVIASPVWASSFAPPIRTFVKESGKSLSGKRIALLMTQGGTGGDKAAKKLAALLSRDALDATLIINEKDIPQSADAVASFCGKIMSFEETAHA